MADRAAVIGAGVFGASTALALVRRGWDVTLVEQYTPGHVRASSGGETRIIRFAHGTARWYARSAWRARALWRQLEEESATELMMTAGVAWFARREGGWEDDSASVLADEGIAAERLDPSAAAARFPSLHSADLAFVLMEPEAGLLRARRAVQALVARAGELGATLVTGRALPDGAAAVVDGRRLQADRVVWACGPWLAQLFTDLVELRITKQDVLFYGAGPDWTSPRVPAWVDYDGAIHGCGDVDGRGFKCAPDVEGEPFDPDTGQREPSPGSLQRARGYLAHRFPALANAPLVGSRVCQYSLTADTDFLVAPHPADPDVWLLGGGSGHGFKHGPALGEYVADLLDGTEQPDPRFRLGPREAAGPLRTAGGIAGNGGTAG
jgi:sarcosine oxidase